MDRRPWGAAAAFGASASRTARAPRRPRQTETLGAPSIADSVLSPRAPCSGGTPEHLYWRSRPIVRPSPDYGPACSDHFALRLLGRIGTEPSNRREQLVQLDRLLEHAGG